MLESNRIDCIPINVDSRKVLAFTWSYSDDGDHVFGEAGGGTLQPIRRRPVYFPYGMGGQKLLENRNDERWDERMT